MKHVCVVSLALLLATCCSGATTASGLLQDSVQQRQMEGARQVIRARLENLHGEEEEEEERGHRRRAEQQPAMFSQDEEEEDDDEEEEENENDYSSFCPDDDMDVEGGVTTRIDKKGPASSPKTIRLGPKGKSVADIYGLRVNKSAVAVKVYNDSLEYFLKNYRDIDLGFLRPEKSIDEILKQVPFPSGPNATQNRIDYHEFLLIWAKNEIQMSRGRGQIGRTKEWESTISNLTSKIYELKGIVEPKNKKLEDLTAAELIAIPTKAQKNIETIQKILNNETLRQRYAEATSALPQMPRIYAPLRPKIFRREQINTTHLIVNQTWDSPWCPYLHQLMKKDSRRWFRPNCSICAKCIWDSRTDEEIARNEPPFAYHCRCFMVCRRCYMPRWIKAASRFPVIKHRRRTAKKRKLKFDASWVKAKLDGNLNDSDIRDDVMYQSEFMANFRHDLDQYGKKARGYYDKNELSPTTRRKDRGAAKKALLDSFRKTSMGIKEKGNIRRSRQYDPQIGGDGCVQPKYTAKLAD